MGTGAHPKGPDMEQLDNMVGYFALGALVTVMIWLRAILKDLADLQEKCNRVIDEANGNLKRAAEVNQTVVGRLEILEDQLKVLDFYRTQGNK